MPSSSSPTRYGRRRYGRARYGATPDAATAAETPPPVAAADAALLLLRRYAGDPGAGGAGPGPGTIPPPSPAGSLVGAVGRCLEGDGALMGLVGGHVGGGAPRKVYNLLAPNRTAPPSIGLLVVTDDPRRAASADSGGIYVAAGQFQVLIEARKKDEARIVADRAASVLLAAAAAGTIAWAGARLMDFWEMPAIRNLPGRPGPGQGRVFAEARMFGFTYQVVNS